MLTIKGTPAHIENMYKRYKSAAKEIYHVVAEQAVYETVPANTNLLTYKIYKKTNNSLIYIVEGFCRLQHEHKSVRLYSDGDFVFPEAAFDETWSLTSEFTTKTSFFDMQILLSALEAHDQKLEKWIQLLALENSINLTLCSFYQQEDIKAEFIYREYNKDDIIIKEGELSREIFEMISGSAIVLRENQELGMINAGEPFGEISFLTASPRTATVRALEKCFVRTANNEQFLQLIQTNPQLIIAISKTLAERVVQLNRRIIEKVI